MQKFRIGTAHFVTKAKAARYYFEQNYSQSLDSAARLVDEKIANGEIRIGKPDIKAGERLIALDNGTRYGIVLMNAREVAAAAKRKQAAEDAYVERAYYRYCQGVQVNVMDIGKIFAHGRTLLATCDSLEKLGAELRAYVDTLAVKS